MFLFCNNNNNNRTPNGLKDALINRLCSDAVERFTQTAHEVANRMAKMGKNIIDMNNNNNNNNNNDNKDINTCEIMSGNGRIGAQMFFYSNRVVCFEKNSKRVESSQSLHPELQTYEHDIFSLKFLKNEVLKRESNYGKSYYLVAFNPEFAYGDAAIQIALWLIRGVMF